MTSPIDIPALLQLAKEARAKAENNCSDSGWYWTDDMTELCDAVEALAGECEEQRKKLSRADGAFRAGLSFQSKATEELIEQPLRLRAEKAEAEHDVTAQLLNSLLNRVNGVTCYYRHQGKLAVPEWAIEQLCARQLEVEEAMARVKGKT